MPPIQTIRLAAITLLLTAGVPLLPIPDSPLPAIAQTAPDRKAEDGGKALQEANRLYKQGSQQYKTSQYQAALQSWQQALAIYQAIKDRNGEAGVLTNLGLAYNSLSQYNRAIEYHQQALPIFRAIKNRNGEAIALNNLGLALQKQGEQQYETSQYQAALQSWQQALAIYQATKDRNGEAGVLTNLGLAYNSLSQYNKAIEFYQQALPIFQAIKDRNGEAMTLNNLGEAYRSLSEYNKAIEFYQQGLPIFQAIKDRNGEAMTLNNLGIAYSSLSQYTKAIEFHQQALPIFRAVQDRNREATALNNLGATYGYLAQYSKEIEFYQQALPIFQAVGNRNGEAMALMNLGAAYASLSQYNKAIEFYQQALPMLRAVGDRNGEALALMNLGVAHDNLLQYNKAIEFYQQALPIFRAVGNRNWEAGVLTNLGNTYSSLSQSNKAIEFYQQGLPIFRAVGDREREGTLLSNIGILLKKQKQPELAIIFYKQSVNVRETIRQPLRTLSRELQESYAQSVSGTYRALADLLLAQGRILEAQQVLELLKSQEIREFTREARTTTSAGIATTVSEAKILKEHGTLIAFGQKVDACKQSRCAQLSQLNDQQQVLTQQYNQTIASFEKEIRQRKSVDDALFDPRNLSSKAKEIVESQPGTVLIYPFVLEDKIWLLWAAKGGIVKSVAVPVSRKQLGETVVQFRRAVQDPAPSPSDRKTMLTSGKQLYDWLIKPLEPELKANKIQNLVFSLDRVTRYIPISALFDGEKFLIENYAVSTILSAELTDLRDRLPANNQTSILALGASEFKDDPPLPNVPKELNAIIQPNSQPQSGSQSNNGFSGTKFLNQAFDFRALRDNLARHKILHIATHGKFVAGRPEDSFLVLGNSEKLTIPEIQTLQDLSNIHLVVLSACETALGGDQDGIEISGLSSYFLSNGAKAVMASLWSVDDRSTSELMSEFYRSLATSTAEKPMTKAEALRQAQLSLIREGGYFAHPHYWAPFTLIGNSLSLIGHFKQRKR
jgi:CHAT domain-containing protein